MKNIVAISGSLKSNSANTAILNAAIKLSVQSLNIVLYTGIGDLPHFNPDIDGGKSPEVVKQYRHVIRSADGILICTPEYVFAVPGVLKNSLDWLVASGEYIDKPVMAISASPLVSGGISAHKSLVNTLKTMSARLIDEASLNIGAVSKKLDTDGNLADVDTIRKLKAARTLFSNNID